MTSGICPDKSEPWGRRNKEWGLRGRRESRTMSMEDLYEAALAAIREAKKAIPDMVSLFDCYAAILHAQKETKFSFHPDMEGPDTERCRERSVEGLALLRPEDINMDWGAFDRLFRRISELSRECADVSLSADSWPSVSDIRDKGRGTLLAGLLEDRALLDETAERAGTDVGMFSFLVGHSATPFLERYAESVRAHIDDAAWLRGYCPVCGGEPLMSKLAPETGRRSLQCHLCRTEWTFKRLECPFCGNSDQEKLSFFYDEEDLTYRVEVCDLCKRYLKTVDTREAGRSVCLLVENLATIHLDVVAQREGFEAGTAGFLAGERTKP